MREFFVFVAQNYAYLLGVAVSLFALRVSWDAYRSGATPISSISRGIGMAVTFFVVITVVPGLFEWGVNSSAQKFQNGTVGRNLLAITQQGVNLAISATNPTSGTLIIPTPIPVTEFVSNVVEEVTGSSSTEAAQPAAAPKPPAAQLAPAALPTSRSAGDPQGPMNPNQFHPAPNDPNVPDLQEWIAPAPTPIGADLPRSNGQFAGPGGETIEQYKARTGDGGGGPQSYTVQSGDNLGKIANRFGVDAGDLCRANLTVVRNNCNLLRSGMVLAIP